MAQCNQEIGAQNNPRDPPLLDQAKQRKEAVQAERGNNKKKIYLPLSQDVPQTQILALGLVRRVEKRR